MKTETPETILREILREGCLTYTESRDLVCFYCGGSVNFNNYGPDTINHERTCAFVRAQTITKTKP